VLGLAEARPVVQVIFMLRFTAGAVLADPERTTVRPQFWAGAAAWYCATVAIYLYNGVTDVVEDRANHSRRPIAGGRLSVAAARRQVAGWALAALVLAAFCGLPDVLPTAAVLLLGYLYSAESVHLKSSVPGAMATAAGLGVLAYCAGFAAAGGSHPGRESLFAGAMALWMACVGPSKDFSDAVGDAAAGRRTGCVALGDRRMRALIAVLAPAVGFGFLAAALGLRESFVLPSACALAVGGLSVATLTALRPARGDRGQLRRPYRAYMVTQYAAHILLLVRLAGDALT